MIDAPGRKVPRFPSDKADLAKAEISKALDDLKANHQDIGLTQGASGGDLLFAECCQAKKVNLQFLQPFAESEFIAQSVSPSAGNWLERYRTVRNHLENLPGQMPGEYLREQDNPFEACNLWMLATALTYGADKLRFICLWNGEGGDGAGGTSHMVEHVRQSGGSVIWLDTRSLW